MRAFTSKHNLFLSQFRIQTLGKLAIALIAVLFFHTSALATQADMQAEESRLISIFKGNNFIEQRKALETLEWSGITSPAVFDLVESTLVRLRDADSKPTKEKGAWYAKALGYSGNQKYRATLNDMAENASSKKIRKYAKVGLKNLDKHIGWNPVISNNLSAAPAGRLMQARMANMLAAEDYWLVRLGAKRVYRGYSNDKELIAAAAKRLKSGYQNIDKDDDAQIDALAWLIKVMAESGDAQYQPLLEEIAANTENKKVRKYAKKYAGYFE